MKNIHRIFLTILVMALSMTLISAQEEALLEDDIHVQEKTEDTPDDITEDVTEDIPEDITEDVTEDITEDITDEPSDVTPGFVGKKELAPAYQTMLDVATADGYMPIDILIQRGYLKLDAEAFIYMDTTYVPLRSVAKAFGFADITWNGDTYVASVAGHGYTLDFLLNTTEVLVNGQVQSLGSPIVLVDGRMMVPLNFLADLLGFEVIWDQTYYTVGLIHPTLTVEPQYMDERFYTYSELQNFAKLVMLEAGDTSYEVHHGVASVVMNRMSHTYFGSSVDGVIFNTEWAVQFPPAHKSNFDETRPNEKAIKAVKYTLRGQNSVETCIFFNTRPFKGKTIYKKVDGVYFMQD